MKGQARIICICLLLIVMVGCQSATPNSPPATPRQPTATPNPPAEAATPENSEPTLTPMPTLAEGEFIATSIEDLLGVWTSKVDVPLYDAVNVDEFLEFTADGTMEWDYYVKEIDGAFDVYGGPDLQSNEIFVIHSISFEGDQITFKGEASRVMDVSAGSDAIYELRVRKNGDTPVELTFLRIKDYIGGRWSILTYGPWKWIGPSVTQTDG